VNPEPIRFAIVIPAYRPTASLVDVVRALSAGAAPPIVVVDDGSGPEYQAVFRQTAEFPNVQLLLHPVNRGKGAALKTGIDFAFRTFPDLAGVVTADADGQHHADDIERIANTLMAHPDSLVLGSRVFNGDVPLRSRIGNVVTRTVMHVLLGQKLRDTQTGLRGIPAKLLPQLGRIESAGYEFELEMLIAAHHLGIPVIEEPIRTIYEPGNRSSHFNPIVDSMKIYFVLLRFGSVSLMTALLDNLIFYLAYRRLGLVLESQVLGRLFAVAFNYGMVRSSVFYSRQRHLAVLPKYLLLVLVSGAASYGGIELLRSRLRMSPVAAKLMVETALFFANFAIQRVFIFRPQESGGREHTAPVRPFSVLLLVAFLALLGVELYGLLASDLFGQTIWYPVGLSRLVKYTGLYLAWSAPLLLMAPWTFTAVIVMLTAVFTAVAVGPLPLLAVVFFLISACALGSRLLSHAKKSQICATLLGAGIYIFLMTLLARVPVNYAAVWAVLLALPVLADLNGVWKRLRQWGSALASAELRDWGERAAFALLVFVLVMHWFVVLKPEASADGLAMHLAIPTNIAANHMLTLQPGRFLWAVMPMGADLAYSVVYLLGGEYGARLLNFAMLLLLEGLLYGAVRRWLTPGVSYLLLALFAATPMVQMVTGSLFVENLLAAMLLGMMTAIWRFGESGEKKFLYVTAVLGGTAVATKFGALGFVLVALAFAAAQVRRRAAGRLRGLSWFPAAGLFLLVALAPYSIAWWKTGNPIYPFLNERIHSSLLPPGADLKDLRFRETLSLATPFDLTFHTHRFMEGQNGSFGFQYLLLVPLGLLAFMVVRRRPAVSAATVALAASLVVFRTEPNARYLYAALPLLLVPFAALLGWLRDHQRRLCQMLIASAVACTALNVYFLPASNWYHKDFYIQAPLSHARRERYLGETSPIRQVIAWANRAHPHAAVLLTNNSDNAGLSGEVYENHWHQYPILQLIRHTSGTTAMIQLLDQWKVRYFIAPVPSPDAPLPPYAMRSLLAICATREYEFSRFYFARLDDACRDPRVVSARESGQVEVTVQRGVYDDANPAVQFRGDWTRSNEFREAEQQTVTYCDLPGAEASLRFEGQSLTYVYTRAPNRGIAELRIDGVVRGELDLYSPGVQWQARTKFCCLGEGLHSVVVRVTGRNSAASTGRFIDLDSFVVE
jgi:glycosyltransferase involved in cell wall biosynthesis